MQTVYFSVTTPHNISAKCATFIYVWKFR